MHATSPLKASTAAGLPSELLSAVFAYLPAAALGRLLTVSRSGVTDHDDQMAEDDILDMLFDCQAPEGLPRDILLTPGPDRPILRSFRL
ncbi:hypothetical protein EDD21DRAFT_416030 [Dissophora ornata]|nr:hypothetical protein EDD21DRAFT_416030 [Dissophora ornata]